MAALLSAAFGTVLMTAPAYTMDTAAPTQPDDGCMVLAQAKHDQWMQHKVLIQQTKTFADGSTKDVTIVVTENTAYMKRWNSWRSARASMPDRQVPPAEKILAAMGLGECSKGEPVQQENATVYSYSYVPDDHGYVAHGKMWISNASGLPLREEMQDPAPPANAMVATAITASYQYNDDFVVPPGAEKAEATRLFDASQLLRHLQSGSGTALGSGRR